MTRIPQVAQVLSTGRPQDLQQLLIAFILRAEDEMLTVTEAELRTAKSYTLITTIIAEENAAVLTVRPK